MDNNAVYEWILHSMFIASARGKSLESAKPYLSTFVHLDDEVLDLCCGTGFVSFWLEEQGAKVTGMDFASYMITLAKQETSQRSSTVEFIEADIFTQDFGQERSEGKLLLTMNNKPIAVIISLYEENTQDIVLSVSRLRAQMAVRSIRSRARRDGLDKIPLSDIKGLLQSMLKQSFYNWHLFLRYGRFVRHFDSNAMSPSQTLGFFHLII